MSDNDLIPSIDLLQARPNPMIWEGEEPAEGVFLGTAEDDALALLGTPSMQLPAEPRLPEDFTPSHQLRQWLVQLQLVLDRAASSASTDASELDLNGLSAVDLQAVNEILGSGEVRGLVELDDVEYQLQESLLPGVWRVSGANGVDRVEIAAVPAIALSAAASLAEPQFPSPPTDDAALMNAPALLAEIEERAAAYSGGENHVINFTLLPMSEADHALLRDLLGRARLEFSSGGFGDCHVYATRYRHVWAVQYVNAMGHTILDTLEIGGVPTAVRAAQQDFEDSALRLRDLLETYLR